MRTVIVCVSKTILGLAICVLVTTGLKIAMEFTTAKAMEVKEAVYDVLPKRPVIDLQEAIFLASKEHHIDPAILRVIAEKESTNGSVRALYRFEPDLYSRLRREKSYRSLSDSEVRMLASSHGAFHILGVTAERECKLHFSKLYDLEVSARCAAKIISNIEDQLAQKPTNYRLREIFRRYNGQGKAAEQYASDAMGRLAAILYRKVSG